MYRLLLLFLLASFAAQAAKVVEDPRERQMLEIARELRCAVCQNQPVSESNADLARDMRAVIREKLQAGETRAEIVDYFVARYGDYVLLKPPQHGPSLPLWVMPIALLLLLGIPAYVYIRHRLRTPLTEPSALTEEDAARVRAARLQDRS